MNIYYSFADDSLTLQEIEKYSKKLSVYRQKKIEKNKILQNKAQSLIAGFLLKKALFSEFGVDEEKVCFSENEHGKPYIEGMEHINFSISHSGNLVAIIIGEKPCGIDAEVIKPYSMALKNRILIEEDRNILDELESTSEPFVSQKEFAKIWTKREAVAKLSGSGLVFTDEIQKNSNNEAYMERNNIYGITLEVENGYIISAFTYDKNIKSANALNVDLNMLINSEIIPQE